MVPSARVLDLFAVPDDPRPLPGGQGRSFLAGDLVLSPGRDPVVQDWLNPVIARLAVALDQEPGRRPGDLRLAVPVPARDGSWVVDGWGASRYEPGTVTSRDLSLVRAAGALLHARLATAVPRRPAVLDLRTDRWAAAERIAFGEGEPTTDDPALARLVERGRRAIGDGPSPWPDQLVHADLAGNVLLDAAGSPLVIDLAPAWRPAQWADAVCVLDAVLWSGADRAELLDLSRDSSRTAMVRAVLFRALSDAEPDAAAYAEVLTAIGC